MKRLSLPTQESEIRALKRGDEVLLSGRLITGRDAAHKHLVKTDDAEARRYLENSVIYHCGPVVVKTPDGGWKVTAAGPTTSSREEPYQAKVIGDYKLRGVIGILGNNNIAVLRAVVINVGNCRIHAGHGLHGNNQLQIFGAPVLLRGRLHLLRKRRLDPGISAHFYPCRKQRRQVLRVKFSGHRFMHQHGFQGVADTRFLAFSVDDDSFRHG